MAKCPLCEALLINPRQCDCGWQAPGVFGDQHQSTDQAYCSTPGCRRLFSVKLQSGLRLCSECLHNQEQEQVDDEGILRVRANLLTAVQNFSKPKTLKRGPVTSPAIEEAFREIEKRQPKVETEVPDG